MTLTIQVTEMPRSYVRHDGTGVELEFESKEQGPIALNFDDQTFHRFSSLLLQLNHELLTRKAANAGHLELRPLAVVEVGASAAAGGSSVIVGFRTDNDQSYPFALQADKADELKSELDAAIASARLQARQTRQ